MSIIKDINKKNAVDNKKRLIGGAILVALVAIAITFFVFMPKEPQETDSEQQVRQEQAFEETNEVADAHSRNNDYSKEAEEYKKFVEENPTGDKSEVAMIKLATAHMNTGEFDEAIKWYEQVRALNGQQELAAVEGLALAYQAKDDKQKAIEYWREASQVARDSGQEGVELLIFNHDKAIERLERM